MRFLKRIMVFASGGGGNFQALCDEFQGSLISINALVVDRNCGAMGIAKSRSIPIFRLDFSNSDSNVIVQLKNLPKCDLIALCGFNRVLPGEFLDSIDIPILNTHPSLLPSYGGAGMIGVKVQEAVKQNNDEYAGCTIHFVDSGIDTGRHIIQCRILVDKKESAWELGGRIHQLETKLYPLAIKTVLSGIK